MDRDLPRGVRRLLRLERADLDDELQDHFRRLEEDLVDEGMDPQDAKREARRRFGDERRWRREIESIDRAADRRRRTGGALDALRDAFEHSIRAIRSAPGLSAAIILAFALGIGANATVYGMLDRLLLSPPAHVVDPDGVVRVLVERRFIDRLFVGSTLSLVDIEDFEASDRFSAVAAYSGGQTLTVGHGEGAQKVAGRMATFDFFDLLGARPLLGRFFTESEDAIGAQGVAVVGEAYWRRSLGASRDVIGSTLDLGEGPYTVIGVAPRGFTGIDLSPVDVWLPARQAAPLLLGGEQWLTSRGAYFARGVARLAAGASTESAEADATRLHRIGREEVIQRGNYDAEARVVLAPVIAARGPNPTNEVRVARWLAGVSAMVLLIACINVANLLLARALRRRRETAIRLALGVSRRRLIGDAIAECMTLALFGGIAALAAARWGGDILRSALLPGVDWSTATSGPQLLLFVGVTAVIAGIASALMPALQSTRGDVNDALRASAGAITRSALRTRGFLSVAQAALSVLLLIGAGLFVRSLTRVGNLDTGFVMDDLYVADFVADASGTFDDDARRAFLDRAIESIARLPVVTGAAAASSTPFMDSYSYGLEVPGLDSIPQRQTGGPYGQAVTPGYFAAMGIRVVRGRALTEEDRVGAPAALVVNESFAELVWPGEDAIGRCVHVNTEKDKPLPPCAAVVGIVATARRGSLNEESTAQYYVPVAQALLPTAPNALFIRVRPGSGDVRATLRSALLGLEPRLRDANVRPMIDLAAYELRPWRLGATLFSAFGLIALVVAALGLYSVLAFDVAQRQREIGLRSALGARVSDVLALVLGRAARLTLAGIALGLSAALLLAPRLGDLLFDTAPRDPLTFTVVALTLLAVGALAAAIPALRAARVDPNVALRAE